MKVLVIIPTYNEAENVKELIPAVLRQGENIEVLIVDDNSPDGTADVVRRLQKIYGERVHLIKREKKMGLGTAYVEGFKFALEKDYDYIFEMDADFSHDPNKIHELLETAKDSADLVIGSRYSHGVSVINWPMRRVMLSYFANLYARKVTGVPVRDMTSGFKCFSRKVLEAIDLDKIKSNGYAFQIEMNVRAYYKGFKIKEHPIIFVERRSGISKMNRGIVIEAALMVWKLKFEMLFEKLKK